jgi:hypothetical protein
LFTGIRFPQTDYATARAARGPNDHHHAPSKTTDGYEPFLSVVFAVVGDSQRGTGEDFFAVRHVEPTGHEGRLPLRGIELDFHD